VTGVRKDLFIYIFFNLKLSLYTYKTAAGRHKHTNIHESNTPRHGTNRRWCTK